MRILILGARADGQAKVVLEILSAMGNFEVVGFIDDDPHKKDQKIRGVSVLGICANLPDIIHQYGIQGAIPAIGNNPARRALAEKARACGLVIVNAIHPTVHVDSDVVVGEGTVLCPGVIVVTGTRIGRCVNVHTAATIDHDNVVDDGANLSPGVHTAGRCRIESDAFLGTGAVILPDITIGCGAVVGAGAVVISSVMPGDRVVGIPAKSTIRKL